MFSKLPLFVLAASAVLIGHVQAHGVITAVKGANGVNGQGFGVIASTPRDGSKPNPFEQDTSVIRNVEIKTGKTDVCGRTKAGGNNDVATQLAAASQSGLPSAGDDGSVTMTLHQVNQDGAGPYQCDVSGDGGSTFQDAQVTQNVPGVASLSTVKATDFTLVAQMPAGMQCAGGPNGDACIMRCRNSAVAGPFGSCVAVSNGGAGNSTATGTAADSATESVAATDASAVSTGAESESTSTAATGAAGNGAAGNGAVGGSAVGSEAASGAATEGKAKASTNVGGKGSAAVKRFMSSRVVGKRSNFWIPL